MKRHQGFEIVIPADRDVIVPWSCVGCASPCESTVLVRCASGATSFVRAPMCAACVARGAGRARWRGASTIAGMAFGATVGALATGWLCLPLGVGVALSIALVASVVASLATRGLGAASPLMEVSADPRQGTTLFATRKDVAEAIAAASGGVAKPGTCRTPDVALLVAWSALSALATAGAAFGLTTAGVTIDNAFPHPIDVSLDGRLLACVAPNPDGSGIRRVRVRPGEHTLGYRAAGSGEADRTTTARIAGDDGLYVPGARACHVLVTSFYASESSRAARPAVKSLPRAEYSPRVGEVDSWFRDNPLKIGVGRGEVPQRTALLRDRDCTALVALGCDDAVVADFVRCRDKATDDDASSVCVAAVFEACPAARPNKLGCVA